MHFGRCSSPCIEGWERGPFARQIVGQAFQLEPPRKPLVDAALAQQVAAHAILHVAIELRALRNAKGLLDVPWVVRTIW